MEKNLTATLGGKSITKLENFSAEEIRLVLDTAKEMKKIIQRDIKKVPTLRGKSIVNLFLNQAQEPEHHLNLQGNI